MGYASAGDAPGEVRPSKVRLVESGSTPFCAISAASVAIGPLQTPRIVHRPSSRSASASGKAPSCIAQAGCAAACIGQCVMASAS